ncbi:pinin isoform X2 [Impatiens glandulifera]|uniref:pinin isoform X2 n=1 Tax=Impatiens glandulifera TaxID=253017 RepID=UPI001FB15E04|nr:pinin isoform X2 [Impatiens glandulifera]
MSIAEKTEEELRKELDELNRQQWEITERLRDPRGIRRGGLSGTGPRNFSANGARQRGLVRPAERNDSQDLPPAKKRLSSAIVKAEEGEISEDAADEKSKESIVEVNEVSSRIEKKTFSTSWRDDNPRASKMGFDIPPTEHVPRVLPKDEDPRLVNRNRRMLGQLLGTLEKFKKEDEKLSGSEAYMRRTNSLQRAEQRAREESEKLRHQEREQIAEKRKRDLTLRARVAAKAEEKRLELLFLRWCDHHRKLGNFLRTQAEPPLYYSFTKPLEEDADKLEKQKELFEAWKAKRREDLSEYEKKIGDEYLANIENNNGVRKGGKVSAMNNGGDLSLQESIMDQELETHRLEHGPKTRKLPDQNQDEEDEDVDVGDDDIMDDDLLGAEETAAPKLEPAAAAGNGSSPVLLLAEEEEEIKVV